MKKIAIFAKHEKIVCEAIVKYFQNKDIKIICIPPMPKEEMFEYFSVQKLWVYIRRRNK